MSVTHGSFIFCALAQRSFILGYLSLDSQTVTATHSHLPSGSFKALELIR